MQGRWGPVVIVVRRSVSASASTRGTAPSSRRDRPPALAHCYRERNVSVSLPCRRSGLCAVETTTHCRPDCPGSDGGRPSAGSVPCGRRRSRLASTCEPSARCPSARLCTCTCTCTTRDRGRREAKPRLERGHSAGACRSQRRGSIETTVAWLAGSSHSLLDELRVVSARPSLSLFRHVRST